MSNELDRLLAEEYRLFEESGIPDMEPIEEETVNETELLAQRMGRERSAELLEDKTPVDASDPVADDSDPVAVDQDTDEDEGRVTTTDVDDLGFGDLGEVAMGALNTAGNIAGGLIHGTGMAVLETIDTIDDFGDWIRGDETANQYDTDLTVEFDRIFNEMISENFGADDSALRDMVSDVTQFTVPLLAMPGGYITRVGKLSRLLEAKKHTRLAQIMSGEITGSRLVGSALLEGMAFSEDDRTLTGDTLGFNPMKSAEDGMTSEDIAKMSPGDILARKLKGGAEGGAVGHMVEKGLTAGGTALKTLLGKQDERILDFAYLADEQILASHKVMDNFTVKAADDVTRETGEALKLHLDAIIRDKMMIKTIQSYRDGIARSIGRIDDVASGSSVRKLTEQQIRGADNTNIPKELTELEGTFRGEKGEKVRSAQDRLTNAFVYRDALRELREFYQTSLDEMPGAVHGQGLTDEFGMPIPGARLRQQHRAGSGLPMNLDELSEEARLYNETLEFSGLDGINDKINKINIELAAVEDPLKQLTEDLDTDPIFAVLGKINKKIGEQTKMRLRDLEKSIKDNYDSVFNIRSNMDRWHQMTTAFGILDDDVVRQFDTLMNDLSIDMDQLPTSIGDIARSFDTRLNQTLADATGMSVDEVAKKRAIPYIAKEVEETALNRSTSIAGSLDRIVKGDTRPDMMGGMRKDPRAREKAYKELAYILSKDNYITRTMDSPTEFNKLSNDIVAGLRESNAKDIYKRLPDTTEVELARLEAVADGLNIGKKGDDPRHARIAAVDIMRRSLLENVSKFAMMTEDQISRLSQRDTDDLLASLLRIDAISNTSKNYRIGEIWSGITESSITPTGTRRMGEVKNTAKFNELVRSGEITTDIMRLVGVSRRDVFVESQMEAINTITRSIKSSVGQRALDTVDSIRIGGMLSSTGTAAKNFLGTASMLGLEQVERGLASGALNAYKRKAVIQGNFAWSSYLKTIRNTFSSKRGNPSVGKSFMEGKPQLGSSSILDDAMLGHGMGPGPLSQAGIKQASLKSVGDADSGMTGMLGASLRAIDTTLGLPNRLMVGTDEFFRQQSYNMQMNKEILDHLMKNEGLTQQIYPERMMDRYNELMQGAYPDTAGFDNLSIEDAVVMKRLQDRALSSAKKTTFQNDIDYKKQINAIGEEITTDPMFESGEMGINMLEQLREVPAIGKLFFPFLRTPINITRAGLERMPVAGLLMRRNRAEIAEYTTKIENVNKQIKQVEGAGGEIDAFALRDLKKEATEAMDLLASVRSRQMTGTLASLSFAGLAAQGTYTGSLPSDPAARELWRLQNKQPHSLLVGGKWINIKTLAEPLAIPMTIASDLASAITNDPSLADDTEVQELMMANAAFLANAIKDTAYLSGIQDIFNFSEGIGDSFAEGEFTDRLERLGAAMASTYIPLNAFARDMVQAGGFTTTPDNENMNILFDLSNAHSALNARLPGGLGMNFGDDELTPQFNLFGDRVYIETGTPIDTWSGHQNPIKRTIAALTVPVARAVVTGDRLAENDFVVNEMDKIGFRINVNRDFATFTPSGQKLTPQQRADLIEITNSGSLDGMGRTMKDEIREVMKSYRYTTLDEDPRPREVVDQLRSDLVKGVIRKRRKKAMKVLEGMYPELSIGVVDRDISTTENFNSAQIKKEMRDFKIKNRQDRHKFQFEYIEPTLKRERDTRAKKYRSEILNQIANEEQD